MAVKTYLYLQITLIVINWLLLETTMGLRIEGALKPNEDEFIATKGDNVTFVCYHERPVEWTYPDNNYTLIHMKRDKLNGYAATITLYNVDNYTVGFHTCLDISKPMINASVYVYVLNASQLFVGNSIDTLNGIEYRPLTVPCRPTEPNIKVTLYEMESQLKSNRILLNQMNGSIWSFDRRHGFRWENPVYSLDSLVSKSLRCDFDSSERNMNFSTQIECFIHKHFNYMHKPTITNGTIQDYFAEDHPLTLTCMVEFSIGRIQPKIKWLIDRNEITNEDGRIEIPSRIYYDDESAKSTLTIRRLVRGTDEGNYTCFAYDDDTNNTDTIDVRILKKGDHFIHVVQDNNHYHLEEEANKTVIWTVDVSAFPRVDVVEWRNNKNEIIRPGGKYQTPIVGKQHVLTINHVDVNDIGNYTLKLSNKYDLNTTSFHLLVKSAPGVEMNVKPYNLPNINNTITCSVTGFPPPDIHLFFKSCQNDICDFKKMNPHKMSKRHHTTVVTLNILATQSGYVKCFGNNSLGQNEVVKPFIVTDVENGFQIWAEENDEQIELNGKTQKVKMAYNDEVTFYCASTKQNYTDKIDWYYNNSLSEDGISRSTTKYSYKVQFSNNNLKKSDSGTYKCKAWREGGLSEERTMFLNVTAPEEPIITHTNLNQTTHTLIYPSDHKLYCMVDGVPRPRITWKKDGHDYVPDRVRVKFENNSQVIVFVETDLKDEGTYECTVSNRIGKTTRSVFMGFSNKATMDPFVYAIIAVLFLGILIVLICLCIKIRKETELKRMLRSVGLEHFEKGQVESLNPEIGIDDQAELLPYYKDHWEIPRENIKLGKQLGAGAFGVVMKADALGIRDEKGSTTVAVKMVKKNVDCSYLKALCSELKIMSHLGSHVNVVNLIGACTGNIAKRELLVVVEFCRFGNLHNYLLRHRGNFINQVDPESNIIDYNIGADLLERSFSVSSTQSQDTSGPKDMQDYRENSNNTAHTQYTATTTVCMTPTGQDEPLTSNNSIQPEWRSNYKGDYKGKIKPICTKDLLAWAFQVARGMEYLAARKVLHGDLAARNILLSDNNIVKICDFGLAKRMYKDDNYKKQNNSPLPIKWMAIESITDRVFSTQSDVWSFGIVMWEFFSLAKTPYPGMEADERLYHKLVSGYRMECPPYSTPEIYDIMSDCWKTKPLNRPTFSKLSKRIGDLLEQTVLRHYIDLNDPYLQMNTKLFSEIQSDYLQMASPPDFASLSTPQYVNYDSGISSPIPGQPYMLMKPGHIFSPRVLPDGEVFTFDSIKKDRQKPDHMEMAPMLNLKDLDNLSKPNSPEPGEIPSYSNPTYNKMPLIKEDIKTKDNYVNMPQNKNKTDLFNAGDKTKDGGHHYVNSVSRDWERDIIRA